MTRVEQVTLPPLPPTSGTYSANSLVSDFETLNPKIRTGKGFCIEKVDNIFRKHGLNTLRQRQQAISELKERGNDNVQAIVTAYELYNGDSAFREAHHLAKELLLLSSEQRLEHLYLKFGQLESKNPEFAESILSAIREHGSDNMIKLLKRYEFLLTNTVLVTTMRIKIAIKIQIQRQNELASSLFNKNGLTFHQSALLVKQMLMGLSPENQHQVLDHLENSNHVWTRETVKGLRPSRVHEYPDDDSV